MEIFEKYGIMAVYTAIVDECPFEPFPLPIYAGKDLLIMGKNQKNQKKSSGKKVLGWIAGILAAVIVLGLVAFSFLNESWFFIRRTPVMTTESCEVDQAMLTYYTYIAYIGFLNTYYEYVSAFGLNTGLSLKAQTIPNSKTTWFENFENTAVSEVTTILVYAEAAKAEGLELTEEQRQEIEDEMTAIAESEKEYGSKIGSTIGSMTGVPGLTHEDIRRCLELNALAYAYNEKLVDSFEYDDAAIDAYFNEHLKELTAIDFMMYTVKAELPDQTAENYEEEKARLEEEAKAKAADLATCTTTEAFTAWITAELTAAGKTEEEIATAIKTATKTDIEYEAENAFCDWAFSTERSASDVYVSETGLTVYLLTKAPERDETPSDATVHALTFDTEEKANEALAAFEAGEKTAEAFEAIAEINEITNSKFEGITASSTTLDSAVIDWVFSDECASGAYKLVKLEKTWCLVFVDEISDVAVWKADAKNAMVSEDVEAAFKELEKKYPVTIDQDAVRKLAI